MYGNGNDGGEGLSSSAMDELLSVTRELRDNLSRLFGASKSVASEKFQAVRDRSTDLLGRGRERASQAVEGTNEYVREEPMKALLIAGGVGLLVGWLIKRSR